MNNNLIRLRNENINLHKNVSNHVHQSITHNTQKVETTQMSTNWWIARESIVSFQ